LDLRLGSACALPFADRSFDRVFSINSVQFWEDLRQGLTEVLRVLSPNGTAAIAIQPRNRGATAETSRAWSRRLALTMRELGFASVREEWRDLRPVPIVCVVGARRDGV
jgi:ubiquinone/menaquinone biosynthesis C-methylase UbiE